MNIMKTNLTNALQMTWAILAVVCVGLAAKPAKAAEAGSTDPQLVVSYADLNLASRHGASVLFERIQSAAVQVCGAPDAPEVLRSPAVNACIHQAIEKAVSRVDNTLLTSQYLAMNGGVPMHQDVASLR